MQHDNHTSTQVEVSSETDANGLIRIGPYMICGNGLIGGHRRGQRCQPICRTQVKIVKEFLRYCRPTRWARNMLSPMSSDLKHWVENWAGPDFVALGRVSYISTGAAIVAAMELGLVCVPTNEGSRNIYIGVCFDTVAARMAERGWYIARDHVTATRIKAPEPERAPDPEFFRRWAAENGVKLDSCRTEDDQSDQSAGEPAPAPHPFWAEWAKDNGINTGLEG